MKVVTAIQMRELDHRAINEFGIPGAVLMDRAGTGAAREILAFAGELPPRHARRYVVLAGKGNNGGDAWVVARRLAEDGRRPVRLIALCPPEELPPDARHHAAMLPENVSCEIRQSPVEHELAEGDIVIDGLLGSGIAGRPRPPFDAWITAVNAAGLPTVALDLPSGLNGDDGTAELAVQADLTITMGLPKRGLIMGCGPQLGGRLRQVDIGLPEQCLAAVAGDLEMIFAADVRPLLSRLAMNVHKHCRGRLLVIGGCPHYLGAPHLAATAALRGGAGLVTLALPTGAGTRSHPAALIVHRIRDDGQGNFSASSIPQLRELLDAGDAAVVGPGLGPAPEVREILPAVLDCRLPLVLDADALNHLAQCPGLLTKRSCPTVLTPHPGEMRRLLAACRLPQLAEADRLAQAAGLAAHLEATVVLKGQHTVIATPGHPPRINTSGCPALATAGTGDVLAGLTGAFLAAGFPPHDAATAAVFIHGRAGEMWPGAQRAMIADDLVALLPAALRDLAPMA